VKVRAHIRLHHVAVAEVQDTPIQQREDREGDQGSTPAVTYYGCRVNAPKLVDKVMEGEACHVPARLAVRSQKREALACRTSRGQALAKRHSKATYFSVRPRCCFTVFSCRALRSWTHLRPRVEWRWATRSAQPPHRRSPRNDHHEAAAASPHSARSCVWLAEEVDALWRGARWGR
jgi:hypothetical protein